MMSIKGSSFTKHSYKAPPFNGNGNALILWKNNCGTVAKIAGCPDRDLACLQGVIIADLSFANQAYFQNVTRCDGSFPMGPSIDRSLIK